MEVCAYILRGGNGRHYIGSTQDIARRLEEHRRGSCHSTRRLGGEIVLVGMVRCASIAEARRLEQRLKRMKNPEAALAFVRSQSSPD